VRVAIVGVIVALTTTAQARPPAIGFCAGVGLHFARPALAEWTYWLGGGAGVARPAMGARTGTIAGRLGAGIDFSLARSRSMPYGGEIELRWGPWLGMDTNLGHEAVEGGIAFDLGMTSHSPFGNLGVRVGGGAGDLRERTEPTGSLTLLYGVRSVVARYSSGGGCVEGSRVRVTDPGRPRRTLALASGARLFATVRADRDGNALWLVGIELEPSFFLPPYSLARFGGAEPD